MKKYLTFTDFAEQFSNEDKCFAYLSDLKWSQGYKCRKCGHEKAVKGRTRYYRKCQRCHYDESCTAHTLFHKLKFPVVKAFMMVYQLSTMKKGMSTCEMSRQYGIHQETAWFFKRKVQQAMSSGPLQLLQHSVEVDEAFIGGYEKGKKGRSKGKKRLVQVAVEVQYPEEDVGKPVIKNAHATVIKGFSTKELANGIDRMVDKDALITTDGWVAYPKAVKERMHLAFPSDDGKNFPLLHWHLFNLKNWLRGTHHRISGEHLQRYLDEFHYRFNRRNYSWQNPMDILKRMVIEPWLPYLHAKGT